MRVMTIIHIRITDSASVDVYAYVIRQPEGLGSLGSAHVSQKSSTKPQVSHQVVPPMEFIMGSEDDHPTSRFHW